MALPDNVLSDRAIRGPFRYPRNVRRDDVTDYSYGGIALQDASQGLETNVWRANLEAGQVFIQTNGIEPILVYTDAGIERISFTFDQNMNVALAFDTNNSSHLYWFDNTLPGYTLMNLPGGSEYASIGLDDHRRMQTSVSDIVLTYLRDGVLYTRLQRERFLIETAQESGLEGFGIRQVGMNEKLRFQWQFVRVPVDE